MSDAVWIKFIETVPQIIGAVAALLAAVLSAWAVRQSKANSTEIKAGNAVIEEVKQGVNGQSEALLKVTGEAEHAKGMKQEKDHPSGPTGAETDPIHVETSKK